MSIEDLVIIQRKLHDTGISHLQYSGGEPLARMDGLLELLSHRKNDVDYWVLTSGYEMTYEKAKTLKEAGLTGAVVSLDHWDEQQHNAFRGNPNSYTWAERAVKNCRKSGLAPGLCLCATKDFISSRNLWKYLELARDWGAGFVRILEPHFVGRYRNVGAQLSDEQINMLEEFFLDVNSKRKYLPFPVVMYPSYHLRRIGCHGMGYRYLYVDLKGDIHPCPFCHQKAGNILEDTRLDDFIRRMKEKGCPIYETCATG